MKSSLNFNYAKHEKKPRQVKITISYIILHKVQSQQDCILTLKEM